MKPDEVKKGDLTILHNRFYPDRQGGVEELVYRIAMEATPRYNVTVLTENRQGLDAIDEASLEGVKIVRDDQMDSGHLWRWPYLTRMRWWMNLLRKHKPKGWIWTVDPSSAMAAILCGHGKRTIFNPPNCLAAMHRVSETRPHVDTLQVAKGLRMMEGWVYQRAAKIVCSSKSLGQQYVTFYGTRPNVHLVPRGAGDELIRNLPNTNVARQVFGISPTAFVVGFVGKLDPAKDVPYLIRSCAQSGVFDDNDRLLIVGDGPDRDRIEKTIADCKLQSRTILTGMLDGSELLTAYACMSTFVQPSLYEGFGMVVLEAMAAGIPVIGRPGDGNSSFSAISELIDDGKTGLLMSSRDDTDLADKLRWFRFHVDIAREMGRKGREQLAKRPWGKVVNTYLDIIEGRSSSDAEAIRSAA